MCVTAEGSEEMSIQVTRKTRQVSMINQILTHIEESLGSMRQDEMQDIRMIDLSTYDLDNDDVLEAIFVNYNAEIIGKRMFIKYDGKLKQRIHRRLANSAEAHNRTWDVDETSRCTMGNRNSFLPDVGIWFQRPTKDERVFPIRAQCPLPDVWIEVFYNRDPDREYALNKIDLNQRQNLGIEFLGIALPHTGALFPQNPNPGIATIPAIPTANQNTRPTRAPYVIHWDVNNVPVYYRMDWNQHIVLRCGWVFDFNIVLNELALP